MNKHRYFTSGVRLLILLLWFLANPLQAATLLPQPGQQLRQGLSARDLAVSPYFEENAGQFDPAVSFNLRAGAYQVRLLGHAALFTIDGHDVLGMKLLGSPGDADMAGENLLPGVSRYFIGPRSQWHRGIRHYGAVRQQQVYPGIDLLYYANADNRLEYDFIVSPGSDPAGIRYRLEGGHSVRLDRDGNLVVKTAGGDFIHHAPYAYQQVDGRRVAVTSAFRLQHDGTVSFRLAGYDRERPLIIDPGVTYAAYLGGSDDDSGYAIASDGQGNVYVTGQTRSGDFPTEAANSAVPAGQDVFVSKFDADGELVFTTYLGTADAGFYGGYETGRSLALDAGGKIYVTGAISGVVAGPGTSGAYNDCSGAATTFDAFLAVLAVDGNVDYFTCLGGALGDMGEAVRLDANGKVYVAGWTASADFPVQGAFQTDPGDNDYDAFLVRIDPQGNGSADLQFASYFGGSDKDQAFGLALDQNGRAYLVGTSFSADLPGRDNALGGPHDGFIAAIDLAGNTVDYSRYLGGDDGSGSGSGILDAAYDVVSDVLDDVYLTGTRAGYDAFVMKLDGDTGQPAYLTLIGDGTSQQTLHTQGRALVVDDRGTVYVAGLTDVAGLVGSNIVAGHDYAGGDDAFVSRIDADGNLLYTLYLGGNDDDAAYGLARNGSGGLEIVGETRSLDYAVTVPGNANGGGSDVMRATLGAYIDLAVALSDDGPAVTGQVLDYTLMVDNAGPDDASNVLVTVQLPAGVDFLEFDTPGQMDCVTSAVRIIECRYDAVAAGTMSWSGFTVSVNDNTDLRATATVTADQFDFDLSDNSVSHTTAAGADVPTVNIGGQQGGGQAGQGATGSGSTGMVELLVMVLLSGMRLTTGLRARQDNFLISNSIS